MKKTIEYIRLSMLRDVGAVTARRLLDRFGAPERIFAATKSELMHVEKIGEKTADNIIKSRGEVDAAQVLEKMKRSKAVYLHIESDKYPKMLKTLDDKPLGLYKIGAADLDAPCVAIVGSRKCSVYGLSAARKFAMTLARAGITIVSGMARGIDTAAHTGALDAGGKTVAVLGCGVDVVYPPENAGLYERIIESGGAVISEFPMSSRADRQNFPIRNRIISGLSLATIVVESDLRGGSMITARVAGEQGRDVFAIPGRIDSPSSRGCHALIRDGVRLASCAEDVLEELAFSGQLAIAPNAPAENTGKPDAPKISLREDESKIFAALDDGEENSLESISRKSGFAPVKCISVLTMLEIKKAVRKTPSGGWEKRF